MQPIVDGIKSDYVGMLTVYQLDYNQPTDQYIAHAYAVRTHPVTLVIDQSGSVVARWSGIVSEAEIVLALRNLVDIP